MIVNLRPDGAAHLTHAEDFKKLALALEGKWDETLSLEQFIAALGSSGEADGVTHAWLDVSYVKALGLADSAWVEQFNTMIAYAEKHGWTRNGAKQVRLHVLPTL